MREVNEGFEIIAAETYNAGAHDTESRIVLGQRETKYGTDFVTWESIWHPVEKTADYFWGHYFGDKKEARADYHRRLLEKYE